MEDMEDMTYSVKEVAQMVDRSEYTVRKWLREKYIKGAKVGTCWRISAHDLNAWWQEKGGDKLVEEVA